LATIKGDPKLAEMQLVRRGRISVVPVLPAEFRHVAKLGKTKVPAKSAGAS
jgi:predicted RNA-binding protein with PUA-like domain